MLFHEYDKKTGGIVLKDDGKQTETIKACFYEVRPVWPQELNFYGAQDLFSYDATGGAPVAWAQANRIYSNGEEIARILFDVNDGGGRFKVEPFKSGVKLEPVDVAGMCARNHAALDRLYTETADVVFDCLKSVREHVNYFFASFSGGKDSTALFIALEKFRALHPDFLTPENYSISFADTDMESADTYSTIKEFERVFEDRGLPFVKIRADRAAADNWRYFGPPSRVQRWCCTVQKTTPMILYYRQMAKERGFDAFKSCSFVGVRAFESGRRSHYKHLMKSTKSRGDYVIYPILKWPSSAVWLSIFSEGLPISNEYKRGNNRIGCLLCPLTSDAVNCKRSQNDAAKIKELENARDEWFKDFPGAVRGWRMRRNGLHNLAIKPELEVTTTQDEVILKHGELKQDFHELLKTIAARETAQGVFEVNRLGRMITFTESGDTIVIKRDHTRKGNQVSSQIRKLLTRAVYCVACRTCEAMCPNDAIYFEGGQYHVKDTCTHCGTCLDKKDACIAHACRDVPKKRELYIKRLEEKNISESLKDANKAGATCFDCSKDIAKDEVGATLKLFGRAEKRRFCFACIARRLKVDEETVLHWVDNWKYSGCKLFE